MRNILILILVYCIVFSSCIGPKRINKWVAQQITEPVELPRVKSNDYITVHSPLITDDVKASKTTKRVDNQLYLLFYNKFDYVLTTTYNPKVALGTFTNTMHTYGNSKGLKQKLNGQQIDLEVRQIPATYGLHDKASVIFLLVAHFTTEKVSFLPDHEQMVINYTIKKDNMVTKNGTITLPGINASYQLKYFESMKKATKEYADQYDENTAILTKQFVDKLLLEL